MVKYTSLGPDQAFSAAYETFLKTHVRSGVTDGVLHAVSLEDLQAFANGSKKLEGPGITDTTRQELRENYAAMAEFARLAGVKELLFTEDAAWYVPPKMRDMLPGDAYKNYLLKNYAADGQPVGFASLVTGMNVPIPAFVDGVQQGGFESGDHHAFLSITDKNGRNVELHQTFMEKSDDPAFRPGIVGVNMQLGEKLYAEALAADPNLKAQYPKAEAWAHALIKNPETVLDSVGMLDGKIAGLVSYQCEMIGSPTIAANWDGDTPGGNFNYIPMTALRFGLTEQQLNVLMADRAVAIEECRIVPAVNSPTKNQNAPGFIPATEQAFYPDGTPRFVKTVTTKTADGDETTFLNASSDANGGLRVLQYKMRVDDGPDRQVIVPYNHYGNVAGYGFAGAANCVGSVGSLLAGIAAAGQTDKGPLEAIGANSYRINGLGQEVLKMIGDVPADKVQNLQIGGDLPGRVRVYPLTIGAANATLVDFCGVQHMSEGVKPEDFVTKDGKPRGLAGKLLQDISRQRRAVVAAAARPENGEGLTLLPTGTVGKLFETVAESLANHQRPPASRQQAKAAANFAKA